MNPPTPNPDRNQRVRSFQAGVAPVQLIELELIPWPEGKPPPLRIGRPVHRAIADELSVSTQDFREDAIGLAGDSMVEDG